jgi:hypothetical protein
MGAMAPRVAERSIPWASMYPPFPQKSVCMSMTTMARVSGSAGPSKGQR